jgi:hypothetical protein
VAKLGRLCAALLFTCALSSSCLACSCVCREPRSFKAAVAQRFNSYPTIFIGTVIEATAERKTVTLAPGHVFPAITYRARFTVEEVFKGATTPILIFKQRGIRNLWLWRDGNRQELSGLRFPTRTGFDGLHRELL